MNRPVLPHIWRLFLLLIVCAPLSFLVGTGCSSTGGALQDANRTAQQGDYKAAAHQYAEVLRRDGENAEARSGLKSAAGNHLDAKLATFSRQVEAGRYKRAYETYREAMSFRQEVTQGTSVTLSVGSDYRSQYQETKEALAEKHYERGKSALANGEYEQAVRHLRQAQSYVPGYEDTGNLLRRAQKRGRASKASTAYEQANRALRSGRYREAYQLFGRSLEINSGYKNASRLQQEALEKGRIRGAILPFKSGASARYARGVADQLHASTLNEVANLDDPFLTLVERENLEAVLREQDLSRSQVVDPETAAKLGKILGVQAVLVGSVTDVRVNTNGPRREAREAWYTEVKDITEMSFDTREVQYFYHEASREVTIEAEYRLVEVETAEIIESGSVDRSTQDQIEYATFQGDHTKLYPFDINAKNVATGAAQSLLNEGIDPSLFEGRKELRPADEMASQLAESAAKQIAESFQKAVRNHQFPAQERDKKISDRKGTRPDSEPDTTKSSQAEPKTTTPAEVGGRTTTPDLRIGRVTGRYLRVRGAQFHEVESGTKVRILDDRDRVIARGIVTSVLRNEATVEVQSRRGFASLREGLRVVIYRE